MSDSAWARVSRAWKAIRRKAAERRAREERQQWAKDAAWIQPGDDPADITDQMDHDMEYGDR